MRALIAGLATFGVLAGLIMHTSTTLAVLRASIDTLVQQNTEMADVPTVYTATWVDTDGVTQEVKTTQHANESNTAFAQRHKDAVEALKAVYPPVN